MTNTLIVAALLLAGLTGGRPAEADPADTVRNPHVTMPLCADGGRSARGTASFVIVDSTAARQMHFGEGNLVFCRTTSATMVWIRFAVSADNDGNDSATSTSMCATFQVAAFSARWRLARNPAREG